MRQYFVYYDVIEETGEIIYVGRGTNSRSDPTKKHKRNRQYNSYAKKYNFIRQRFEVKDIETALELEAYFIDIFHTWVDDPFATKHVCNIVQNDLKGFRRHSQESRNKMKESAKNRPRQTEHDRKKRSESGKKYYQEHEMSLEARNKIKLAALQRGPVRLEIRQKISNTLKGRTHNNKTKNDIPVYCYDLNDNILCYYQSISKAAKASNVSRYLIKKCCLGKLEFINELKWKFKTTQGN